LSKRPEGRTLEFPIFASGFYRKEGLEKQCGPYEYAVLGILVPQWEICEKGVRNPLESLLQILGILGILLWEFWEKSLFVNA
jgi:hypothetical protein